jgi:hypothetical protein
MADRIVLSGLTPWDGRYELDLDEAPFTTREWGWLKKYAGYLPITLDENTYTDPEVIAVLAIIAMRRSGKIENGDVADLWERLQDAPFGPTVKFEFGDREDGDADGPPAAGSGSSTSTNGDSSQTTSASSDSDPKATGSPASATSASAPQTSVS